MTDTATGISVTPDILRGVVNEIAQLDEQLDAASGSESAGKRALGNALASENEHLWKQNVDGLIEGISQYEDIAVLAGVYSGIKDSLDKAFKAKVDEYLTAEAKMRSDNRPQVSAEQIQEWTDARKKLIEHYKAIKGILDLFEQDTSGIPEPKKRSGARGKRGPRVLTGYDWFVDGEKRTDTQNSLSSIANTVCTPLGWKTADLRSFLEENGINLQTPPEEFEVDLPDPVNKKLSARLNPEKKAAIEAADADVEEDEEADEEDNGETE
jgi:hypothetical protein